MEIERPGRKIQTTSGAMPATRHHIISIAGLDPSGGAGLLADAKTGEALGVHVLGVCSAITFQTEDEFMGVSWVPLHQIELQLDLLMKKYRVEFLKIGLIQRLEILDELLQSAEKKYPSLKMIWDPVLKASAGFQFHQQVEEKLLHEILSRIYLVTPNSEEAMKMMPEQDAYLSAKSLSRITNVFVKSLPKESGERIDVLLENKEETEFLMKEISGHEKHGSGCVLSSAITAHLAKGSDLKTACGEAKKYVHDFLKSTPGLLGIHSTSHAVRYE
jgi:hydroxymethylpyrimidine/phosphomethylpyrimidine kinase